MKNQKLVSTNPAKNYEVVGSVNVSSLFEIKQKVEEAQKAKKLWKELGIKKRLEYVQKIYDALMARKEDLVKLIIKETGKSWKDANSELDRYGNNFKWFLENGEKSLVSEVTFEDEKTTHRIVFEPYGVAAVITPWNHPFGGYKESGMGREHGKHGFQELTQIKVISSEK